MSLPTEHEYGFDPQGRHRFYGIYSARVTSISDPLKKYRIQVQIPQLHGTEIRNHWIPACLPVTHLSSQVASSLTTTATTASGGDPQGGTVTVSIPALTVTPKTTPVLPALPTVGQNVWIMFEAGDPEKPVWIGVQA